MARETQLGKEYGCVMVWELSQDVHITTKTSS
jgi:hypothetical protein